MINKVKFYYPAEDTVLGPVPTTLAFWFFGSYFLSEMCLYSHLQYSVLQEDIHLNLSPDGIVNALIYLVL